jgi:hypothetical protein
MKITLQAAFALLIGSTTTLAVDASGNATQKGHRLLYGNGNAVTIASAGLAPNTILDTTVAVTGAVFGTDIAIASPVATPDAHITWCAWVSANDVITVRVQADGTGSGVFSTLVIVRVVKV